MKKKLKPRKNNVRIYWGPPGDTTLYLDCAARNAPCDVELQGRTLHALMGENGKPLCCHLARMGMAPDNLKVLSDKLGKKITFFNVLKSKAHAVYDVKGGTAKCFVFWHGYGKLVDLNDTKESNQFILDNPGYFERSFRFHKPYIRTEKPSGGTGKKVGTAGKPRHAHINADGIERGGHAVRGALARAVKAGFVDASVARTIARQHEQLEDA